MPGKNLLSLFALLPIILLFNFTAAAQETEPAIDSALTEAKLPTGAVRISPRSIPAEISDALKKMVEAGEGKIRQGDAEVVAWSGTNYKRASAANLINQLRNNLQAKGWAFRADGKSGDVNVFSAFRETPTRRGVIGFYVPSDEALVVAWTEVLPVENASGDSVESNRKTEKVDSTPVKNSGGSLDIVGTWTKGMMSMMADRNTVTGATTPSNGSTFKYVFYADGRFEFVGLMQSTTYGCTTSLFNDKRGTYQITGAQITLIPGKNFWRNTYSCSPASNKERDYVLDRETFNFSTKTDEYGKQHICLTNAKGETCYQRDAN